MKILIEIGDLKRMAETWIETEQNSPYGFDEYGTKIAALDGYQCAEALLEWLARYEKDTVLLGFVGCDPNHYCCCGKSDCPLCSKD